MTLSECPVRVTLDVLRGKWKPLILYFLKQGTLRYGELRKCVYEPSEKVLVQQLRELEAEGILKRTVYPDTPPRVEYSVTEYGNSLMQILQGMSDWGEHHRQLHRKLK